jgi:hypothetical protein
MKSKPLGMLLQEALDAAFCGEIYYGPERIAHWGQEIVCCLQEGLPGQEQVQAILWGLARRILRDGLLEDNGTDLSAHFLENQGAFLRTLLILFYGELPENTTAGWNPPPLH